MGNRAVGPVIINVADTAVLTGPVAVAVTWRPARPHAGADNAPARTATERVSQSCSSAEPASRAAS
jgi:hypothetical protein